MVVRRGLLRAVILRLVGGYVKSHTLRLAVTCLSVAMLFSLGLPVAPAQTSMGRVSGTVTDASNAAVAGAKISVINVNTGARRTVETDSNGFYLVTNLPTGNYSIEVGKEGFKTRSQKALTMVADGHLTADFQLEVGNLQQTVEVVSAQ